MTTRKSPIEMMRIASFPQSDKKDDTVEILMDADDFEPLPNGMDARINEQIKAKFDKQV